MTLFLTGIALFIGAHLIPALPGLRARVAGHVGDNGAKGVVAILALAGLVAIIYGYRPAQASEIGGMLVWSPPDWTRHIAYLLMVPVFPLFVASYLPAGHITARAKHPQILAVKLWAAAHLLVNGLLASVILFAALLAWGVFDRISLKRRDRAAGVVHVAGDWRNDAIAVFLGLATLVWFILEGHEWIVGVGLLA